MPEAVIVDAIRTPIGRAMKGSLKDVRADDLAAVPIKALVERNPDVDFSQTVDVMMGAAFGAGEQGYNIGRNAALLAGLDHHVPGVTRQPLLRLVAADAAHGLPRDHPPARATSTSPPASRLSHARRTPGTSSSTPSSTARRARPTTSTSRWA